MFICEKTAWCGFNRLFTHTWSAPTREEALARLKKDVAATRRIFARIFQKELLLCGALPEEAAKAKTFVRVERKPGITLTTIWVNPSSALAYIRGVFPEKSRIWRSCSWQLFKQEEY